MTFSAAGRAARSIFAEPSAHSDGKPENDTRLEH
jgi:hypothetical protein